MTWLAIIVLGVFAWIQHSQIKALNDKVTLLEKWRDMKAKSEGPWA